AARTRPAPGHRLGPGGPPAHVLRGAGLVALPLRSLRQRRDPQDHAGPAGRVLRGAGSGAGGGPQRPHWASLAPHLRPPGRVPSPPLWSPPGASSASRLILFYGPTYVDTSAPNRGESSNAKWATPTRT